jgi:glycine/D-amino acid oxidase-like deaminating enzyme
MTCRGARVQVIDPGGVGAGASGGVVGALAPHVPERWNPKKAFQFRSLIGTEGFLRSAWEACGISAGYARSGRLQPLNDAAAVALAQARAGEAAEHWGTDYLWQVIPATQAGEWVPASGSGFVLHDTLSARLDPMAACKALAGAITARGGRIVADAEEAGAVVWATGSAGLAALSGALGKQVGQGIKGQAAVLALDRRDLPQLYAEGLHIVPHADGTVAIGSTTERLFESANDTDAQLDDVIVRARAAVPVLGDAAVIRRWAGLRPRARTRAPMLGAWPGRPGQYVANGGFKIGFGVAVEVARVMADLVLDGCDAIPDGFRIEDSL